MAEPQRKVTEKEYEPLKVTAWLASPIVYQAELPYLDAMVEWVVLHRTRKNVTLDPAAAPPEPGAVPSPILREQIGGHLVPRASAAIAAGPEYLEHIGTRIDTSHVHLLDADRHRRYLTTGGEFRAYYLPLRLLQSEQLVWFAVGNRRALYSAVKLIRSLGKKRSYGYGRIAKWEVEPIERDMSWWAAIDGRGSLLMRPLPLCSELPADLFGMRRDFGAVAPPYWHPGRWIERVVPAQ
ncbi:MAG TPA: hypothetical protein G4O05_03140 [Caldilineae bacterium]|nr:hypothetical protein [Caldilineae bacterium]